MDSFASSPNTATIFSDNVLHGFDMLSKNRINTDVEDHMDLFIFSNTEKLSVKVNLATERRGKSSWDISEYIGLLYKHYVRKKEKLIIWIK